MKSLKFSAAFIVCICIFSLNNAFAQCPPCPPIPPEEREVPEETVRSYKNNFKKKFRATRERKKTHSISVDFSKESIIKVYLENFVATPGIHHGINVHFISYGSQILPGHKHNNQIGLAISPTNVNCQSNFDAYNVVNNSFNQRKKRGRNNNTPYPNRCDKILLSQYKSNYRFAHANGDPDRQTKYAHFKKDLMDALYGFLTSASGDDYKGIRFNFGSYNAKKACGQQHEEQIILLISTVRKDGSTDYSSLYQYIKENFTADKQAGALNTLNHGTLCPSQCPGGEE